MEADNGKGPERPSIHHPYVRVDSDPLMWIANIAERFGYQSQDIVVLTDDTQDPRTMPTRANIIKGMQWLVDGAQRDDALFFH
jgi:hypothetical protein